VILWRLLPRERSAALTDPGGALCFPRELQGAGRHDNPERYGCLYVSESPVSAVAEALAPFRGTGALSPAMLVRAGAAIVLAQLQIDDESHLIDLDEPRVLSRLRLRPSQVATNARAITQAYATRIFDEHPTAVGLRWWSTIEASLANLTLYDRAADALHLIDVQELTLEHPATREAADLLGLAITP
jgi:hypothetical protein